MTTTAAFATFAAILCSPAFGQAAADKDAQAQMKGLAPRATPGDYQAQIKVGAVTIAAEFAGHAVPTPEAIYSTEDYVVVELALFGAADATAKIAFNDFSLRINGKPMATPCEPYARSFASLKDPEWEPPASESKAGKTSLGGSGGQNDPPPSTPKMPFGLKRTMQLRVQKAALPEGDRVLPVAGLIFFNFHGKAETIRTVELVYDGAAGKTTLPLHP